MAVWALKAHPRFERDLKKLSKADKKTTRRTDFENKRRSI